LPSFAAGRTALDLYLSYVLDFAVEKKVAVYRTVQQPARWECQGEGCSAESLDPDRVLTRPGWPGRF